MGDGDGSIHARAGAVRLLVLEDIVATRAWLACAASDAFGGAGVATAGTLAQARRWLADLAEDGPPIVALVDLGLPDGSGVAFIGELIARAPGATIVVTTIYDDDGHLLDAMVAGASGYLLKDRDADEIGARLQGIVRGDVAISPAIARRILQLFRNQTILLGAVPADPVPLTARETDVLRLIGRGLKVSEAAAALVLSDQTVSSYVKAIYRKLDISSRAEAALEAARRGLA